MTATATLFITDKSGKMFFKEIVSINFIDSVERDLERHIKSAKLNPKSYSFLDLDTVRIKTIYNN